MAAGRLVYLGGPSSVSIDLGKLASHGQLNAFWIDPRTGEQKPAGSLHAADKPEFHTPEGWEDALLILE